MKQRKQRKQHTESCKLENTCMILQTAEQQPVDLQVSNVTTIDMAAVDRPTVKDWMPLIKAIQKGNQGNQGILIQSHGQDNQGTQCSQCTQCTQCTQCIQCIQEAFTALVVQFQPLIRKTVRRFAWAAPVEDLLQEALLALYLAAAAYDDTHIVKFPGYAETRIRYALWNYSKRMQRYRNPESEIPLLQDDDGEWVDPVLLLSCPVSKQEFEWMEVCELLQQLSGREQLAARRLLLDKQKPGELAQEFHVSVETVKTWRKRAIQKLKKEWTRLERE